MRFFICAFILFFGTAFAGQFQDKPKTYTVTMTLQDWSRYSNGLQYAAEKMRHSDLPSKEVALVTDSIIAPFLQSMAAQINAQMAAENKKDSADKKAAPPTPKKN